MKKRKGRLLISLLTVFMMVFAVIPYMGASVVEADNDPYIYMNNSWQNSKGDIIDKITYLPQSDGTFDTTVRIDLSHLDSQTLYYDVGAIAYTYKNNSS